MAVRKKQRPARRRDETTTTHRREILAITLVGLALFAFLSCVSWGRGDNVCGPTGEALGGVMLRSFGYAAYLPIFCVGFWGLALFVQRLPASSSVRLTGILLCLVSFAGLLAHVVGDRSGPFPAGGVVGEYLHEMLVTVGGFGVVGTRIVLVVLTLITFMLATDIAYYASLATGARWLREQGGRRVPAAREALLAVAGAARERVRQIAPGGAAPADEDEHVEGDEGGDEEDAYEDEADDAPEDHEHGEAYEDEAYDDEDDGEAYEDEGDEAYEEDEDYEDGDEEDEDGEDHEGEDEDPWDEFGLDVEDDEHEPEEDEAFADEEVADPAARVRTVAPSAPRVTERADAEPAVHELSSDGEVDVPQGEGGGEYRFPSPRLLDEQETVPQDELDRLLAEKTDTLERTLTSFRVDARVVEIQKGPVISMFEMELAPGIKVEKVRSLEDDLAIALRARSVRVVAPIPGKNTIGIEVPNPLREVVRLKPLLGEPEFTEHAFALPIFLGRDAAGRPLIVDLAKMPHLLVAGATGSGKSVCLNTIIVSLLYTRTPDQVKLILIDPKMVELSQFKKAPQLACPVVSDMKRAPGMLEWAVQKMEERYRLLAAANVRSIYAFNKLSDEQLRDAFGDVVDEDGFERRLPFIVIIVDELADLMMTSAKEVETSITRLAAKSRAVGIHLILATQRPSTNVITGLIKANLPTRIAFMVSSKIDSRVILDVNGAEQLLGEGDMLFLPPRSSHVVRGQATYLSDEEVRDVMRSVSETCAPTFVPDLVQRRSGSAAQDPSEVDDMYDAAVRFVFDTQRGSASLLQRKFAIGYTRASRLIDLMAEEGVLGEYKGSQAREITMTLDEWVARNPQARGRPEEEGEFDE